jgi:GST-like protein
MMSDASEYAPPKVWVAKPALGRFANINRPVSGATHEKELPIGRHPLQLYSLGTPNGVKVTVMLEELLALGHTGAEYDAWLIKIGEGDQFGSGFVAINPNSKIPALMDRSGPKPIRVFESGAILLYLAEKSGKFLSQDAAERYQTIQWLMFQMGGVGPMFGQAHHFLRAAPSKIEYGIKRYVDEAKRLYGVLEKQLASNAFAAGADYTIADMAIFPWTARHEWHTVNLADFPNVKRWYDVVNARPAVTKGMAVPYLN